MYYATHTHTHTHTHTCMYHAAHTDTHTHTYPLIHIHTHIHTHIYTHTHTHTIEIATARDLLDHGLELVGIEALTQRDEVRHLRADSEKSVP